jgi:hypothetical protein
MAITATNPTTGQRMILSENQWISLEDFGKQGQPGKVLMTPAEKRFRDWYAVQAEKAGLSPDPDDPLHKYDYRAAFAAGQGPELSSEDNQYHWPSQFKAPDHPNRFVNGMDTKTGQPVPEWELKTKLFSQSRTQTATNPETGEKVFLDHETNIWLPMPKGPKESQDTFFKRVGKAWETGKAQNTLGQLRYQQLTGNDTPEIQKNIDKIKASIPPRDKVKRSLPERAITGAAEMLPIQIEGLKKGSERGLALGMGAGALAALAGQAGPQVALPEEIITVPAAFAGMYGVGAISGATENIGQIEAGLAYDELLDLKDDKDRRLNPTIAKAAASGVGVVNGLIELSQIKLLLKTIPGGEKILTGAVREATKKVMKSKALNNLALKYAGKYGMFIAGETAQEIGQESTNIVAGELAKSLSNELEKSNIPAATREEIVNRLTDTAEQSALSFAAMGLPGTVVSGVSERGKITKPDIPPDNNIISRIKSDLETGAISLDQVKALRDRVPENIKTFLDQIIAEQKQTGPDKLFEAQTPEEQAAIKSEIDRQRAGIPKPKPDLSAQTRAANQAEIDRLAEAERQEALKAAGLVKPAIVPGAAVDDIRQRQEIARRTGQVIDPERGGFDVVPSTAIPMASEGMTATNPKTGERVILKDGSWVPYIDEGDGVVSTVSKETRKQKVIPETIPETPMAEVGEAKQAPEIEAQAAEEATKTKAPAPSKFAKIKPTVSKVTTLRGMIKKMGHINPVNFKGEVNDWPTAAKYMLKKDGLPIDIIEKGLKDEGWLKPDEDLLELLRTDKDALKRGKVAGEMTAGETGKKTEFQKKEEAEKLKEREPEGPPEGRYRTVRVDELPDGHTLTIIENRTKDGWDEYEVIKTKEGVTLQDGVKLELEPWDQVEVLESDLPKVEQKAESKPYLPKESLAPIHKKLKTDDILKEALRWQGAHINAEKEFVERNDKRGQYEVAKTSGKSQLDSYLIKKFGIDRAAAHEIANDITARNLKPDTDANVDDFAGEEWADFAISKREKPKFINETPGAIEVKTPAELSLRQDQFGKQRPTPIGEAVSKKNQQGLGLVVEDRKQPGLFGKKVEPVSKKEPEAPEITEPAKSSTQATPEYTPEQLASIEVNIKAVKEDTGSIFTIKEKADKALKEIDEQIETYYALLDCVS